MKIAILTLPLHTNYGGILQAYALQTVLQRMGHQVEILQKEGGNRRSPLIMPLVYGKRMAYKILRDWNRPVLLERKQRREAPVIRQYVNQFMHRYLNLRVIDSLKEISPSDYDAIVVGSDQIWRRPYFRGMWGAPMKDAFLDFTAGWNIKRIAYAASFGIDNLDEYSSGEIMACRKAIQKFDAISVREDSGVSICKDKFGMDATHVLDPTMLLNVEDYIRLVESSGVEKSPGDMLCYILDPSQYKSEIISKIADKEGLTPFNVSAEVDNMKLAAKKRIQPPIEAWLRGFMDAKFVVTDSFHACVFSIIFGKPFIAIGNPGRGMDRFTSLLKMFGLEDRLFCDGIGIVDSISKFDIFKIKQLFPIFRNSSTAIFNIINSNKLEYII